MFKASLKRTLSAGLRSFGSTGVLDRARPWIERRLVPKLLDANAVPAEPRLIRLRSSPARVLCTPYVRTHWTPYWFGRLYERDLQLFLERTLRPGDTYVDVGMNYGHFAYLAGALVGPKGTVEAFEPNPDLARLVRSRAAEACAARLTVHEVALGAEDGRGELSIPVDHSGGASLRGGAEPGAAAVTVPVVRGDTILPVPPTGARAVVKIDVEGFEPNVVAGMEGYIREHARAVVIEVTPEWLGEGGVRRLFEHMERLGCSPWRVEADRRGLTARQCAAPDLTAQENVYFVKAGFESDCGWKGRTG